MTYLQNTFFKPELGEEVYIAIFTTNLINACCVKQQSHNESDTVLASKSIRFSRRAEKRGTLLQYKAGEMSHSAVQS